MKRLLLAISFCLVMLLASPIILLACLYLFIKNFNGAIELMCDYNDEIFEYKHQSKEELKQIKLEKEQRRMARGEG